jgi:hypothetical protein
MNWRAGHWRLEQEKILQSMRRHWEGGGLCGASYVPMDNAAERALRALAVARRISTAVAQMGGSWPWVGFTILATFGSTDLPRRYFRAY